MIQRKYLAITLMKKLDEILKSVGELNQKFQVKDNGYVERNYPALYARTCLQDN